MANAACLQTDACTQNWSPYPGLSLAVCLSSAGGEAALPTWSLGAAALGEVPQLQGEHRDQSTANVLHFGL